VNSEIEEQIRFISRVVSRLTVVGQRRTDQSKRL